MAWTLHRSALARRNEVYFNGAIAPDPAKFYLILTNGTVITDQSTIAQVAAAEISASNGYARMPYNPGAGTYDNTQNRYEMPPVTVSITATGAGLQYDTVILISNATAQAKEAVGDVEVFQIVGSTTIAAAAEQSFIVSFNSGGNGVDVAAA
ncbi:MAG: hypothetical protein ACRCZS_08770 [Chroococcidiopsis sp.]